MENLKHWAVLPATLAFYEVAVWRQAALTPAWRHGTLLLRRAVAVSRVVRVSGVETGSGTAEGAVELQAGNDGLGEWGGRRGRRRWRSIVMILTTHNGRLLHLQTMVFRYQRERKDREDKTQKKEGGKARRWEWKIKCGIQKSCRTW